MEDRRSSGKDFKYGALCFKTSIYPTARSKKQWPWYWSALAALFLLGLVAMAVILLGGSIVIWASIKLPFALIFNSAAIEMAPLFLCAAIAVAILVALSIYLLRNFYQKYCLGYQLPEQKDQYEPGRAFSLQATDKLCTYKKDAASQQEFLDSIQEIKANYVPLLGYAKETLRFTRTVYPVNKLPLTLPFPVTDPLKKTFTEYKSEWTRSLHVLVILFASGLGLLDVLLLSISAILWAKATISGGVLGAMLIGASIQLAPLCFCAAIAVTVLFALSIYCWRRYEPTQISQIDDPIAVTELTSSASFAPALAPPVSPAEEPSQSHASAPASSPAASMSSSI